MADKILFLSHIHEERELALMFKSELESEFGGFVDVFVSSDGVSIPAGANFLKRIEDGLVSCVGALYLISPKSVSRTWISFELGAVWVRNAMNMKSSGVEIPAMPVCHSGMTPSSLPAPLSNLNGVVAGQSSQLESAFRSLQAAVGGKGTLKTDFDKLAGKIVAFERSYTLGASLIKLLTATPINIGELVAQCEANPKVPQINLVLGFVENSVIDKCRELERSDLHGYISVSIQKAGIGFGPAGAVNGAELTVGVPTALILQFKTELLALK
ncbi:MULTISPECIES: toll/interleukin-1 receptor domain-containing protein [unclassified Mesorhizobium]|uniref:toll/interleukin-1 receptor domain-containing protein n=1 Tax=unclassified Mesorhizobium TaxID=325217 RepID=UPI000FCCB994|nr:MULTISPECIES: toll/interleukin-1 receptor domain-containing protein [unclassified Mesorhizobium]RUV25874.1 toll/interleukin-1 receptor domain-containing protein [Mesorhizobium sp. M1A.F.Ca.IN.022.04.1.1]RWG34010.1 MAG: toll/interleukin-1 receptor domain-containing protein [Mesorhizobium sp.]TIS17783.1 MAG: TIR domain-containing protein [Mesorhizobium sp.]